MIRIARTAISQSSATALADFMGALAASGRLFRFPEDALTVLFANEDGSIVPFREPGTLGAQLVYGGIVQVVDPDNDPVPNAAAFTRPLGEIVRASMARLPTIKGLLRSPSYRIEEGALVPRQVGFDALEGFLVTAPPAPPGAPPDASFPHLRTLFSGLLFADEVYRANLLGTLCAMAARSALAEFPIILLDARQKSSGKTQVAAALRHIISSVDDGSITYSGNEHEFEIRLGSYAGQPGPNLIHVDNVRAKQGGISRIRSQALSAAVHSHVVKVRRLHAGPVPLSDPIIVFTMNGARVEGDLADKVVAISFTRPPSDYVHRPIIPHPTTYARQYRLAILDEIAAVLQRVRLVPIEEFQAHTRFYLFEQIVYQSAAVLGLDASFDPRRVRATDVCVDELLHLVTDEGLECPVPFKRLQDVLQANPSIRELNEQVSSASRSQKGKAAALREYVVDHIAGHTYRWKNKVVKISVDNDALVVVDL